MSFSLLFDDSLVKNSFASDATGFMKAASVEEQSGDFIKNPMTQYILLVDDNEIQAATRKAILERAGRAVVVSNDGAQALALLTDNKCLGRVGLVITDHVMPGMNGPALVGHIRQFSTFLPVLVLSGLPEAEEEYQGLEVVFRCKPFPPGELIALVNELLDQPIARTA